MAPARSSGPSLAGENISALSKSMFHDLAMLYKAWLDAGRSNLMQGYASSMATAGFLFDSGLMNPQTYANINLLSNIMDVTVIGESIFTTVFSGTSPFTPALRTALDSSQNGGGEDEDAPESTAKNAASTLALAAQIAATVG